MLIGQKHLIECRCILRQHRDYLEPPKYSFIAFSIIDENNNIIEKYMKCDNCDATHRIYEFCKSEILNIQSNNIATLDDVKRLLPEVVSNILTDYDCKLWAFEEAKYIIDNALWGRFVILTNEPVETGTEGKKLVINKNNNFSIEYWKTNN
ncbi:MAG: hypothetical protein AABY22_31770 [Nanoarchaeota archaeon]